MKKKQVYIIILHILAWSVLIAPNMYVVFIDFHKYSFLMRLVGLLLAPILFYLNYSFLIKKFLFRKRNVQFVTYSISTFIIICAIAFMTIRKITIANTIEKQKFLTEKYKDVKEIDIYHIPPFQPDYNIRKTIQESIETFYLLFSIYGISIIIPFIIRWYDTEKRMAKQEKDKLQAELKYLKGQINPHFLFNSLNNIYALASRKSDNTTDAILKLSSILRYILYEASIPLVPISKELEHIHNYIDIQKLRLTDKVKVVFNTKIDDENKEIEPLLLIPLVENAFKYGVDSSKESEIIFDLSLKKNTLEFKTQNTIANLSKDAQKLDSGIGLKNVQRRLELTYNQSALMNYFKKDNIFVVEIKIHLNKHEMYSS